MLRPDFGAVIFDLDGVITQTAQVHSSAWKEMFDEYLMLRQEQFDEPFREFTHIHDYLPFVDGKPRYKGVKSFLESRNIVIPSGDPADPPGRETICGLGNRKNTKFNEILVRDGVNVYESSVALIKELRKKGIRIGLASSSKNCEQVINKAGIAHYFETRVDGIVSADLQLKGKPEPDIFTRACDNLGIPYDQAVVIEDAVSGVQAGAGGNFGLVIGVARENNISELKINGADLVVTDLGEISFRVINDWFKSGYDNDSWSLTWHDYVPEKEKARETLTTTGNGYLGIRGAQEESKANNVNYPGTYIAGVYNRLISSIAGKDIENEDMVNCPNWLSMTFRINGGDWLDLNNVDILSYEKNIDFRTGLLTRNITVRDEHGHESRIRSRRFASMDNPHLVALEYLITPLNYSAVITIRSELDGTVVNAGVQRYRQLRCKHLEPVSQNATDQISTLLVRTTESGIEIAGTARLVLINENVQGQPRVSNDLYPGHPVATIETKGVCGQALHVEKIVAVFTSNDKEGTTDPLEESISTISGAGDFVELLDKNTLAWEKIWEKLDIKITGDRLAQKLIRLNLYHSTITASPHTVNLDAGIPARGLSGESYRGHIFWDEIFILPLYTSHFPEISASALKYRYRRLNQARKTAKKHGFKGAMYPWQSGRTGREETPAIHLNPISGEWGPDFSAYQRHVSLSIAYNIIQYYHFTKDRKFIKQFGLEILVEICRWWSDAAQLNPKTGRYEIQNIMGPNEYHERNPNGKTLSLKDNCYTNILLAWVLQKTVDMADSIHALKNEEIVRKTGLTQDEMDHWTDIRGKINIPVSEEGLLEQYDGYFKLSELDWERYKKKYGTIERLDRILKAEGKSPDNYKVNKQADALMIFYLLSEEDIQSILKGAGYRVEKDFLKKNFEYYFPRTSHGSTLSRLVHCYLAGILAQKELCWSLYREALKSDYNDNPGSTVEEGIHTGVMAGSAWVTHRIFAGLNLDGEKPEIKPDLPDKWRKLSFRILHRSMWYQIEIEGRNGNITLV